MSTVALVSQVEKGHRAKRSLGRGMGGRNTLAETSQ